MLLHSLCLDVVVATVTNACLVGCCIQIPYFNAPIFLENKTQIGKVEEILGSIKSVVSVLHLHTDTANCCMHALGAAVQLVCCSRCCLMHNEFSVCYISIIA